MTSNPHALVCAPVSAMALKVDFHSLLVVFLVTGLWKDACVSARTLTSTDSLGS